MGKKSKWPLLFKEMTVFRSPEKIQLMKSLFKTFLTTKLTPLQNIRDGPENDPMVKINVEF